MGWRCDEVRLARGICCNTCNTLAIVSHHTSGEPLITAPPDLDWLRPRFEPDLSAVGSLIKTINVYVYLWVWQRLREQKQFHKKKPNHCCEVAIDTKDKCYWWQKYDFISKFCFYEETGLTLAGSHGCIKYNIRPQFKMEYQTAEDILREMCQNS